MSQNDPIAPVSETARSGPASAPATAASPPAAAKKHDGSRNLNPPGLSLMGLLGEDLATHDGGWLEQGFWAIAVHRFGNWRMGVRSKLLRAPLSLLYKLLFKVVEWTCGITLPYTVQVGRRVRIWHHGGMILHAESIGDDVHIRQNTTFGIARRDELYRLPVIGDRCDIGCGVCILGAVKVGPDSVIGANAVVLRDLPPRSVAVGIPAKVIKTLPQTAMPEEPERP